MTALVGAPVRRVDGPAKVTGQAKYAAEWNVPGLLHGFIASSTIAKGRIRSIDTAAALRVKGVLHVFTHENRPNLALFDRSYRDDDSPAGSPFRPLYDNRIVCSGQPIALVVAESREAARLASSLLQVEYDPEPHETNLQRQRKSAYSPKGRLGFEEPPKPRGKPEQALTAAPIRIDAEYFTPAEHHNPMEPHATTVIWEESGALTVYDKTQGVQNSQRYISQVFGISTDEVRVLAPFVGGAFGSGLRPQYQLFLAVMAARELQRSVRVEMTRQQMFTFGHRPATWQRVALGATEDGKLQAIEHEAIAETSHFEDYVENVVTWSGMLYQCDNVSLDYKVVKLDVFTPLDMRAPGAALGIFALECAMDELAHKAGMDPIELRLKNYSEHDQLHDHPYSSKELRACYEQGAAQFGWAARSPQPRSMRDGKQLVGMGMATGAWEAMQMPASAKAVLSCDGKLTVSSATTDIGTGTYTVMSQLAADALGLGIEDVQFKLGDTDLPTSPMQGGSWTVSSVGTAVKEACEKIRARLFKLAQKLNDSPLANATLEEVIFTRGMIQLKQDPSAAISFVDAMRSGKALFIEEKAISTPAVSRQMQYTRCTHSAVFVEVKVDEDLGTIEVSRVVSAIAGGRIVNPSTARSQILGGVVWGMGMALQEESVIDHQLGRFMKHNLADYHFPVSADVHKIEVIFVQEDDSIVNPLGVKGLGEIGIIGVAAAIANAIFHATGRRVHSLPITLDKLL